MPYKDPIANIDRIRKSRRDWYYRNKEKQKIYKQTRDKELRLWFKDFKSHLKCNRCPEDDYICLDFHHLNPNEKEINVTQTLANSWSKKRILKEIDKCEVICSNCHRKEHRDKVMATEQSPKL